MIDFRSSRKITTSTVKLEHASMYALAWQMNENVHDWHKKLLTYVSLQLMKN